MLLVKQVAAIYHKTDMDDLTPGQVRGFGRSLKAAGIKTIKIRGKTYIDARRDATAEGIIRNLRKARKDKLATRKGNGTGDVMGGTINPITEDVVAVKPVVQDSIQLPLFDEPPSPTTDVEADISRLLRTIERQAERIEFLESELAARDAFIGSIQAQLLSVRNKLFNATVRKAVAEYGD